MKIVYIVPGVGDTFYCQNCVRNLNLVREIQKQGHTPLIVPMYLPLSFEESNFSYKTPIFFGAINVYLREKLSFYDKIPNWIKSCLESKVLLHWVSKNSGSTDPDGLEEMTLSIMRSDGGKHVQELMRMIDWMKNEVKPDVVHLSNGLLIGIGVKVKEELGVPVYVTLQDEDQWIDKMKSPYAMQAWELIAKGSEKIDMFMPVSSYYAEFVRNRTGISKDKMSVIPIGLNIEQYQKRTPEMGQVTIGYLSRMTNDLGLNILVDAYILLKKEERFKDIKLKIRGGMTPSDKRFVLTIKNKLKRNGYWNDVDLKAEFKHQNIGSFFDKLTVLSVPAPKGEAFGLFIIESLASGIPVVQPDVGGYSELVNKTGGGVVYKENTAEGLANALSDVLINRNLLEEMSKKGREGVEKFYAIEHMAKNLLNHYLKND